MTLFPVGGGFGTSAGSSPDLSFLDIGFSGSIKTTHTFTDVDFGSAEATRVIIVCVGGRAENTGLTVASATIGGVSAAIAIQATHDSTGCAITAILTASVPTGSSGSVAVTFSGNVNNCSIGVYRALNLSSNTPDATASDNTPSSGVVDLNVNTTSGGIAIATSVPRTGGSSCTQVGVTEDFDFAQGFAGGSAFPTGADTPLTITHTQSDTTPLALAGCSAAWS
jgi:hypothetical protein